jgi:preprotein translocase subunit SecD
VGCPNVDPEEIIYLERRENQYRGQKVERVRIIQPSEMMKVALVMLLVVLAGGIYLGTGARPNLGLDLQGGIEAIYTPQLQEGAERPDDFAEIVDEAIEVIRSRVDALGVAEPDIARSGTDVMVQLPGIQDAARVQELIGTTAQLFFRPVEEMIPPGTEAYDEGPECGLPIDEREELAEDESGILCGDEERDIAADPDTGELVPVKYRVGPAALTGDRIDDATDLDRRLGELLDLLCLTRR